MHEFLPVIGFWVDDAIESHLAPYGVSIVRIFDSELPALVALDPKCRFLNLNSPPSRSPSSLLGHLRACDARFRCPGFVTSFTCADGSRFSPEDLLSPTPWFTDVARGVCHSPRPPRVQFHDIPRAVFSFRLANSPADDRAIIESLRANPRVYSDLLQCFGRIHRAFSVAFDRDRIILSGGSLPLDGLFEFIAGLITTALLVDIPRFVDDEIEHWAQDQRDKEKTSILARITKRSRSVNELDDFRLRKFRLFCDCLIDDKSETAQQLAKELPLIDSERETYEFIRLHFVMQKPVAQTDDFFRDCRRFMATSPQKYVLLFRLIQSASSRPVKLFDLLRRLKGDEHPFHELVCAVCYERLAGLFLSEKRRKAALCLQLAFEGFTASEDTYGHALRTISFVQNLLSTGASEGFVCGTGNLENLAVRKLSNSWKSLMFNVMSDLGRMLQECDLWTFTPLLYINLWTFVSGQLAENVMMGYFNAVNNPYDEQLLNKIRLPIIAISGVRIQRPEESRNFAKMATLWAAKMKSSLFRGTFGRPRPDARIPIVCGEPLEFRVGFSTKSSVRANLTNVHLYGVIEQEFVSEAAADFSEIPSRRRVTIEKETERVEHLRFEVTDVPLFKTLKIIPTKSCDFSVSEVAFTIWDVSNVVIPIPEFKFQVFTAQPSLQVSLAGIPRQLADSEVREISIIARNIGDAALSELVLIHDAIGVLEFGSSDLVNDFAVVRVINDGIRPMEEVEIFGRVLGQSCSVDVHLMWSFKAPTPFTWRNYCQEFRIESKPAHQVVAFHVRMPSFGPFVFADVHCNDDAVVVTHAVVQGRECRLVEFAQPRNEATVPPSEIRAFLLKSWHDVVGKSFDGRDSVMCETAGRKFENRIGEFERPTFDFEIVAPSVVRLNGKRFVMVDVAIRLQNRSNDVKRDVIVTADDLPGPKWTGVVRREFDTIQVNEIKEAKFACLVFWPMLFNVCRFQIYEKRTGKLRFPFQHFLTVEP
jgi:hypothetical protein